MERWASSINNQTVPFSPIFCPLRASCCWMETSRCKWGDAWLGEENLPHPSPGFCPFAVNTEGEREGRERGASLEAGMRDSRAASRGEPISRAALPSPLTSQFNLEIQPVTHYRGFAWAGGRWTRSKCQERRRRKENHKCMEEEGHYWWHCEV